MNDHSVIDTLEAALGSADPEKRLAVLDNVTDLFISGAKRYSDAQIALFDEVFLKLSAGIEVQARRKLARSLAPLEQLPKRTVQRLAHDPSAAVASPVLRHVLQLEDSDIVAISRTGSEAHLHAISGRPGLAEDVTDILVERGGRRVARALAGNADAQISDASFGKLVTRAGSDELLAQAVGTRRDIPRRHFVELLRSASASVRVKLAAADPMLAREVEEVVSEIVGDIGRSARIVSADPAVAKSEIDRIAHPDRSGDVDTLAKARARKFDQTATALSLLCRVPLDVAERALAEDKPDMLLIIAKVANCSWKTTKGLLHIQAGDRTLPIEELLQLRGEFVRLQVGTAQRVLEHYRERRHDAPDRDGRPAPAA
jgi:uncharacterized protein (DUF2336 family)